MPVGVPDTSGRHMSGQKNYDPVAKVWYWYTTGKTAPPPGGFDGYDDFFLPGQGRYGDLYPITDYTPEQMKAGELTLGDAWGNAGLQHDYDTGKTYQSPYLGAPSTVGGSPPTAPTLPGADGYDPSSLPDIGGNQNAGSPMWGAQTGPESPFYVPGSFSGTTGGGNIYPEYTGDWPSGPDFENVPLPPQPADVDPLVFAPYGEPAGLFTQQMVTGGLPRSTGPWGQMGGYYGGNPFLSGGVGNLPDGTMPPLEMRELFVPQSIYNPEPGPGGSRGPTSSLYRGGFHPHNTSVGDIDHEAIRERLRQAILNPGTGPDVGDLFGLNDPPGTLDPVGGPTDWRGNENPNIAVPNPDGRYTGPDLGFDNFWDWAAWMKSQEAAGGGDGRRGGGRGVQDPLVP